MTKLTHTEKKKDVSFLWFPVVVAVLVVVIGSFFHETEDEKAKKQALKMKMQQNQAVWVFCWVDPANPSRGRCGKATKINIGNDGSMSFRVFFSETGITTDFWKSPFQKEGEYIQPGEKGIWFLEETEPGKFKGWIENNKREQLITFLEKSKLIN